MLARIQQTRTSSLRLMLAHKITATCYHSLDKDRSGQMQAWCQIGVHLHHRVIHPNPSERKEYPSSYVSNQLDGLESLCCWFILLSRAMHLCNVKQLKDTGPVLCSFWQWYWRVMNYLVGPTNAYNQITVRLFRRSMHMWHVDVLFYLSSAKLETENVWVFLIFIFLVFL